MKTLNKRINKGYLAKHSVQLKRLNDHNGNLILASIEELPGVNQVKLNVAKESIEIEYDASQHFIDEILSIITDNGAEISTGWWNQLKLGFSRQTDQNIRDNAGHHPACCSKPPVN